jgi:hypothetical protein
MHRSHSWKQSGNVSLWYYTENERNFPGWHLTADDAGCESLIALLDSFAAEGTPTSRAVGITPPSKAQLGVPNNRAGLAAWRSPHKLRLAFSDYAAQWSFPLGQDPAVLTIGSDWLAPLREGISGIPHGRGDYSIGYPGKSSPGLWFWW